MQTALLSVQRLCQFRRETGFSHTGASPEAAALHILLHQGFFLQEGAYLPQELFVPPVRAGGKDLEMSGDPLSQPQLLQLAVDIRHLGPQTPLKKMVAVGAEHDHLLHACLLQTLIYARQDTRFPRPACPTRPPASRSSRRPCPCPALSRSSLARYLVVSG